MSLKSLLIMLVGLAALASISLFCINHHSPLIEDDLQKRTTTSLKFEGMEWSRASTDGQLVRLNGFAPNQALRQKAGEVALSVWGVDAVMNHLVVAKGPEAIESVEPVKSQTMLEASKPSETTISPYEFKLEFDGKTAILSGFIPNEKTRSDIREATRKHLEKGSVITRLEIVEGAPEGFAQTITQGLIPNLESFTEVTATLQDSNLNITGTTSSSESRDTLRLSISSKIPSQIVTAFNVEIPQTESASESPTKQKFITADLCQKQIDDLLSDQQVTFLSDKAIINESSFSLLDSIALTANKCPNTKIEIAGHTDANGGSNQNQTLSQKRADAVLSYIASKGIDTERLSSTGYGDTRPIATNTTQIGQAKNRRIEFLILEQ